MAFFVLQSQQGKWRKPKSNYNPIRNKGAIPNFKMRAPAPHLKWLHRSNERSELAREPGVF